MTHFVDDKRDEKSFGYGMNLHVRELRHRLMVWLITAVALPSLVSRGIPGRPSHPSVSSSAVTMHHYRYFQRAKISAIRPAASNEHQIR